MSEIISINPATLEEIARIETTPEHRVKEIVDKSRSAFSFWSQISFRERAACILRARKYLIDHMDEFALTITRDNGKPLAEAYSAEIYPVADLLYWASQNAEKILRPQRLGIGIFNLMLRRSVICHQPLGVIGIISPWNYPFSIPAGTAAMALLAGNCAILKPSSATPVVGQKIEEMFRAAGLPDGVFMHIPGDSKTGEGLLNSNIDKIIFTGSVEVGRHVAEMCAKRLIPTVLELGGKDAAIIRADADLEHASSGVVWGAFTNAGQCCASIERVYVHESVSKKFTSLVVEKTKKLRIGNGEDPNTDMGPMTTLAQLQTVEAQVEDARKRGATILCGGKKAGPGYFFEPTVLTNVDHSFACVTEETFGPILPIMTYQNDGHAVNLVNDSKYGLNAYIWSQNTKEAREMASKIRSGTVVINDCVYTHAIPQTPWGGLKHSGTGRTHGAWGFYELTNLHHIHINVVTLIKDFWWYPYSSSLVGSLKRLACYLTDKLALKIKGLPWFVRVLFLRKN